MPHEITKQNNHSSFQPNWKMVFLISRIERFDELWPSIVKKEHSVVNKWIIPEKQNIYDLSKELNSCPGSIMKFKELTFWYKTENVIHPLIRCLLFAWYLRLMPHFWDGCKRYDINLVVQLLIESGYKWVRFIPCDDLLRIGYSQHLEINEWIISALEALRNGQEEIMREIDLCRSAWKLVASEELLLYIIEYNQGIRTTAIAKKLGASIATVKRMLNRLIENRMIERSGIGRGTNYRLV